MNEVKTDARSVPVLASAWRWRRQIQLEDAVFLLPGVLIYTLFLCYPALSSFYYSLTDWDGLSPNSSFIGLDNFTRLWEDGQFWRTLRNTLIFAGGLVIFLNLIAFAVALALDGKGRLRQWLRVLFLVPTLLSGLSIGYIWSYMYSPNFGVINTLLDKAGLGSWKQDWLGDAMLALPSVIFTHLWQWTGFHMIIFLAALQGVAKELLEAAEMDGSGPWQRLWHIIIPQVRPAFTISVILATIGGLKVFDTIMIMTQGGPGGATDSLSTLIYRTAFNFNDMGYASAIGLVMLLFIMLISIIQLKLLRRGGEA
ncbi:carbohydrate ABC transporter permease [Paenibacillus sp. y28]|uniref:carbohydrate ABC transporter permease n=1 Tax=Paenibacillus sp. y28 TaxID=3129110 RepID=UPI0030160314